MFSVLLRFFRWEIDSHVDFVMFSVLFRFFRWEIDSNVDFVMFSVLFSFFRTEKSGSDPLRTKTVFKRLVPVRKLLARSFLLLRLRMAHFFRLSTSAAQSESDFA